MRGLVVTRRDGERILFSINGTEIGWIAVVTAELNRVSLQLVFKDEVEIKRAEIATKGSKVDRYA